MRLGVRPKLRHISNPKRQLSAPIRATNDSSSCNARERVAPLERFNTETFSASRRFLIETR